MLAAAAAAAVAAAAAIVASGARAQLACHVTVDLLSAAWLRDLEGGAFGAGDWTTVQALAVGGDLPAFAVDEQVYVRHDATTNVTYANPTCKCDGCCCNTGNCCGDRACTNCDNNACGVRSTATNLRCNGIGWSGDTFATECRNVCQRRRTLPRSYVAAATTAAECLAVVTPTPPPPPPPTSEPTATTGPTHASDVTAVPTTTTATPPTPTASVATTYVPLRATNATTLEVRITIARCTPATRDGQSDDVCAAASGSGGSSVLVNATSSSFAADPAAAATAAVGTSVVLQFAPRALRIAALVLDRFDAATGGDAAHVYCTRAADGTLYGPVNVTAPLVTLGTDDGNGVLCSALALIVTAGDGVEIVGLHTFVDQEQRVDAPSPPPPPPPPVAALIGGLVAAVIVIIFIVVIIIVVVVVVRRRRAATATTASSSSARSSHALVTTVSPPPSMAFATLSSTASSSSTTTLPAGYGAPPSHPSQRALGAPTLAPPSFGTPSSSANSSPRRRRYEIDAAELQLDTVRGPLGEGAFGVVWRGRYRGMAVAVKQAKSGSGTPTPGYDSAAGSGGGGGGAPSAAAADLADEARKLVEMAAHANIVRFYGVVRAPWFGLVTEFCAGGALDTALYGGDAARRVAFTGAERLALVRGVAHGVAHLHAQAVVHRDLAARNVLLERTADGGWLAKVADFGMSRDGDAAGVRASAAVATTYTTTGPLAWMAPEQIDIADGRSAYSARSDVWAYGVVVYEVYARAPPWHGESPVHAAMHTVKGDTLVLPPPPATPPAVVALAASCFAYDAAARPSMRVVAQTLDGTTLDAYGDTTLVAAEATAAV